MGSKVCPGQTKSDSSPDSEGAGLHVLIELCHSRVSRTWRKPYRSAFSADPIVARPKLLQPETHTDIYGPDSGRNPFQHCDNPKGGGSGNHGGSARRFSGQEEGLDAGQQASISIAQQGFTCLRGNAVGSLCRTASRTRKQLVERANALPDGKIVFSNFASQQS